MGFLDNSTNSIVLDAVLTEAGRAAIAANDGTFKIHKFAFGDDEVDYGLIQKYGRAVGREKIEKNTAVFECITATSQALKYRLVNVSNPNLIRLPILSLSGDSNVNSTSSVVSLGSRRLRSAKVTVEQTIQNETTIDAELRDQVFSIEMSNMFLALSKKTPDYVDAQQKARYTVTKTAGENAYQGSQVQFTLTTKSITDAQFDVYGTTANKNIISTYVTVRGLASGAVKEFRVNITKGN